jgi:hypothetical protein
MTVQFSNYLKAICGNVNNHGINAIPHQSLPILGNSPLLKSLQRTTQDYRRNSRLHGTPRWSLPNFQNAHAQHISLSITFFISSSRCRTAERVVQAVQQRFLTRPCYPYPVGLLRAAIGAAPARHKRHLPHGHSPSIQRRPTNQIIEAPKKTSRAAITSPPNPADQPASHNRVIHPENSNTSSRYTNLII